MWTDPQKLPAGNFYYIAPGIWMQPASQRTLRARFRTRGRVRVGAVGRLSGRCRRKKTERELNEAGAVR